MSGGIKREKPLIMTFYALAAALRAVHLGLKPEIDRLHDVWKMGAPVPSSRLMQPKIHDPRVPQEYLGNHEARIVFPKALRGWMKDVLTRRGMAITDDEAMKLVSAIGKAKDIYKGQR